jgi:hypothetical protein
MLSSVGAQEAGRILGKPRDDPFQNNPDGFCAAVVDDARGQMRERR